jgi:hypothetical protein
MAQDRPEMLEGSNQENEQPAPIALVYVKGVVRRSESLEIDQWALLSRPSL